MYDETAKSMLIEYLNTHELSEGLGTVESACSMAAINLALVGKLTDKTPICMSKVIGDVIITFQDAMPHELRNSKEWKDLLPLAVGTGRYDEKERSEIVKDFMWEVLTDLQPIADKYNHGESWASMLKDKTNESCIYALNASRTPLHPVAVFARRATADGVPSDQASECAATACERASLVANWNLDIKVFWQKHSPAELLQKLITISDYLKESEAIA